MLFLPLAHATESRDFGVQFPEGETPAPAPANAQQKAAEAERVLDAVPAAPEDEMLLEEMQEDNQHVLERILYIQVARGARPNYGVVVHTDEQIFAQTTRIAVSHQRGTAG